MPYAPEKTPPMNSDAEKLLNALGMARRAGELIIGQDKIFDAVKRKKKLAVFVADDCSQNVLRTLKAAEERGAVKIIELKETDRTVLGGYLGISSAQAAALPEESGFVKKFISKNCERSDADE